MAEITAIILLTLLNGLFSLAEMAVVSSRRVRLQASLEAGHRSAGLVLHILENPSRFLSTVQVAITLIAITTGFLGGAAVAENLRNYFAAEWPRFGSYAASAAIFLVVSVSTFLSIVIGELVPKDIALSRPEAIACALVRPMGIVMWLFSPFSSILAGASSAILRLLRIPHRAPPRITEEEIRIMVREGEKAGSVDLAEKRMVENVFNLDDCTVSQLMTPRSQVLWLDANATDAQILHTFEQKPHSYYPVCDGAFERVLGVFPVKAAFGRLAQGSLGDLRQALVQPLYVPESMKASRLLELFKQKGQHFTLVVDEYGVVQGVATLHNVMEAIVGDMPASQATERPILRRDDGSYLIDGSVPVTEFAAFFHFDPALLESRGAHYATMAGLVTAWLQRIPLEGDAVDIPRGRIEVIDMDGVRVDKLLFMPARAHAPTVE